MLAEQCPCRWRDTVLCSKALAPLTEAGYVEIVFGGAEQGKFLTENSLVNKIHLTGSAATYDAIVWQGQPKVRPATRVKLCTCVHEYSSHTHQRKELQLRLLEPYCEMHHSNSDECSTIRPINHQMSWCEGASTAHSVALQAQKRKEQLQRLSMCKNTKVICSEARAWWSSASWCCLSAKSCCVALHPFWILAEICELQSGVPPLKKPITAELGCVTPCIVTPGKWSKSAIQYHAEECAASLTVNAGHNCCKLEVIITAKDWPQRQEFMQAVKWALACHLWTWMTFVTILASLQALSNFWA